MLSTNSTTTPRRPLPPAKARKSSSGRFASPLPYTPSGPLEDILLDSPIPVTAQLMNAASKPEGIGLPGSPSVGDWMNEKSREELSGLLLKADGIIKSRETELTLTSSLCKSLYTDNVTLKSKHEALLARLPVTRTSTPTASRPSSPLRSEIPTLDQSLSYSAVEFPTSPGEPLQSLSVSRLRRTRRISVTPSELASLSDQNAELIEKLEELETESLKADQAGKRKLRKLEQEIQSLRDDLEKTQARGAELEAQAKAAVNAVSVQKRKEEREARLQALKEKSASFSESDISAEEIRDFAPPSRLPTSRSSPIKRTASSSTASTETSYAGSDHASECTFGDPSYQYDLEAEAPESYFPTPPGSNRDLPPPAEYAIISQLLSKIRELEETNAQIKEEQKVTEERMRATQWDAESIRRIYDCLGDGDVDLEIQQEDDTPPSSLETGPISLNDTIRFSSLRRTIVGDISRLMASESDVFARGIDPSMQSTVRDGLMKGNANSKARKTVVGLFDAHPGTSGEYPPTLRVSSEFRSIDSGDISTWSSSATDGLAPPSPSMGTLQTPLDGPGVGRTLGSELGSEFGDDWAERGINHHLRASSLVDLAGMYSSPASPSESVAVLPPISFSSVDQSPAERWDRPGPSTPPRIPNLQLQPPTPTPDQRSSTRQFRLSQTVRARTNRWVEGRFQTSQSHQESLGEKALRKRSSNSTLGRRSATNLLRKASSGGLLSETFDSAVGQIKRVTSRGSFPPLGFGSSAPEQPDTPSTIRVGDEKDKQEPDQVPEADRSVSLRPGASVVDPTGGKHDGIVGFVLQAWLWLQFAIVVAIFLWTMAKRGPKVVLEAERRNANRAASKP